MEATLFIFIGLIFVGGVLMRLPVVTGFRIRKTALIIKDSPDISLSGRTLFISDLHLRFAPVQEQFNLDFSDTKNVVIVGDFFHIPKYFWQFARLPCPSGRRAVGQGATEEKAMREVLRQLVPKQFSGRIFFIHGNSHDPKLRDIQKLQFENFEFQYLGEYGKFNIDGTQVVAYHGHQLFEGVLGGGISWVAEKLGHPLVLERFGRKRLNIPKDAWTINGHSHVPNIDKESKTANSGSFVGVPFNFFFRVHIGSGVLVDKGDVQLLKFEGLNFKKLYPI